MGAVYDFFGGRKFFFALLLWSTAVVFVVLDKADFTGFSQFVMWVFGIFAAGNIGSKAFKDKTSINPKT